ncbi:hypothetical protein FS749_016713 [Ceratobasidium sp. UAMH 11750]|nr:hypothetical protein FS749_016713 [Ceratobasidium sp. UAMH 11750]
MISKAISQYARQQENGDEQSDDEEQEEDDEEEGMQVDEALERLKKGRKRLIAEARKNALAASFCSVAYSEAMQLWNQYLDCLDRGSPLHAAAVELKPAKQNIGRIEKLDEYSKLSKAKRKKAEATLRLAFDSWGKQNQKTSRAAAKRKTEQLGYEMHKYNEDSYYDKNKAINHVAKPSKLVAAAAALSSKVPYPSY